MEPIVSSLGQAPTRRIRVPGNAVMKFDPTVGCLSYSVTSGITTGIAFEKCPKLGGSVVLSGH